MTAQVTYFPVDNGDMTLIELESGGTILIDVNIRESADEPDEPDVPDVAQQLRERLQTDDKGRLYVDAFVLTHPDEDHCRGLQEHFHLASPDNFEPGDDKIFIRELWSAPLVFRRYKKEEGLCEDARAFKQEAQRRVEEFRNNNGDKEGNRAKIIGEDDGKKAADLDDIKAKTDTAIERINGSIDETMSCYVLGPRPRAGSDDKERSRESNNSSMILRFSLTGDGQNGACYYLTGGDAGVEIWEELSDIYDDEQDKLNYDLLLTPHHCSWRSLSHYSWSKYGEDARVSPKARRALEQAYSNAILVASSKTIDEDQADPPCVRAKREYEDIAKKANGAFRCVADFNGKMFEVKVTSEGPMLPKTSQKRARRTSSAPAVAKEDRGHG